MYNVCKPFRSFSGVPVTHVLSLHSLELFLKSKNKMMESENYPFKKLYLKKHLPFTSNK